MFPVNAKADPWVVLAWEGDQMLYLITKNGSTKYWSLDDHEFHPAVLIVRGGQAINGKFP